MAQHDVVISYAPRDRPAAEAACAGLEARGVRCWVAPRDVPAGADERAATLAAVARGRAVLRVVPTAGAGEPALGASELEHVVDDGATVIPIRAGDAASEEQCQQLAETLRSLPPAAVPPPPVLIEAVAPAELTPVVDEPGPGGEEPAPAPAPAGAPLFSAVAVKIDSHTALASPAFPFAPAAAPAPATAEVEPPAAAALEAPSPAASPRPAALPPPLPPSLPPPLPLAVLPALAVPPAAAASTPDENDEEDEPSAAARRPFPRKLALAAASVAFAASASGFFYARVGRLLGPAAAVASTAPRLVSRADDLMDRPVALPTSQPADAVGGRTNSPATPIQTVVSPPIDVAPRMSRLPAADLDRRLKAVTDAAAGAGLSVGSLKTKKTIRRPGYDLVPVEMTASAEFAGHLKFLRALHANFADAGLDEFELSGLSAAAAAAAAPPAGGRPGAGRKIRCTIQFAWCTAPAAPADAGAGPTPLRQRDWSGLLSLVAGAMGKDLVLTGLRLELMDGPEGRVAPTAAGGDRRRADRHTARVRLKGEAATEVAIAGLVSSLSSSKGVRDVRLVSAGLSSGEKARKTFEVELTVSGDEQPRVLVARRGG